MKRILSLAAMAMMVLGISAQMNVWKDGKYEQYAFDKIDSITFGEVPELALQESNITLEVGASRQLTAYVSPKDSRIEWASSNVAIATITEQGLVQGVAIGTATITARANGIEKACTVFVVEKDYTKGSTIWPIVLDETVANASSSKIATSFAPNEASTVLYIWENTYAAGSATGKNFYGNEGGYMSLTVNDKGWSGLGFCLTEKGMEWENAEALRAAIVENPDDYYLHLAIRSTDTYSHCFYIFGAEGTKFVLGSKSVYDGAVYSDFTRDGTWQEFDIPMSKYATALASATCVAGVNIFVVLSEGVAGAQLNLDAVYFYKK